MIGFSVFNTPALFPFEDNDTAFKTFFYKSGGHIERELSSFLHT
jgi:hypothetical protein